MTFCWKRSILFIIRMMVVSLSRARLVMPSNSRSASVIWFYTKRVSLISLTSNDLDTNRCSVFHHTSIVGTQRDDKDQAVNIIEYAMPFLPLTASSSRIQNVILDSKGFKYCLGYARGSVLHMEYVFIRG